MAAYIVGRLVQALVVLFIVTIIVFLAARLLPGDPILLLMTGSQVSQSNEEQLALLRHEAGIDRPLLVQYGSWINGLFHGDLGKSILTHLPVTDEILRRIPITLSIGLPAFIIGLVLGILVGVVCAVRRGKLADEVITFLANIGITIPTFWLGFLLITLFGLHLNWLPIMGYTSPFDNFWLSLKGLIMPVACLAVFPIASTARLTRSSMLAVMREDYIRTAWSKGLDEKTVITRHGLKNGLIPIATMSGMGLGGIIGGAAIIEVVFNIPGIGRLAVDSISSQDYPYLQGVVLITAASVVIVNLLIDLAYTWFDPRIKYR
jgi:peptide/nickel transport system permease protein